MNGNVKYITVNFTDPSSWLGGVNKPHYSIAALGDASHQPSCRTRKNVADLFLKAK
jgi:hypothetical protein